MKNLMNLAMMSSALLLGSSCSDNKDYVPVNEDLNHLRVGTVWSETLGKGTEEVLRLKLYPADGKQGLRPPRYTVFHGIPMADDGTGADEVAGDFVYTSVESKSVSKVPDQTEWLYVDESVIPENARVDFKLPTIRIECKEFCLIGYGQTCCGLKCETAAFGGKAWFCVGGCECSSTFTW